MAKPTGWLVRENYEFISHKTNKMSDQAFRTLIILEYYARTNAYCFPTNERLIEDVGKTEQGMGLSLKELEEKGWIRRFIVKGQKKIKRYGFIMLRRSDPSLPAADTPEKIAHAEEELLKIYEDRKNGGKTRVPDPRKLKSPDPRKLSDNKSPLRGDTSQAVPPDRPLSGALAAPSMEGKKALLDWATEKARLLIRKGYSDNDVINSFFANRAGREANRVAIIDTVGDRFADDDQATTLIERGINIAIDSEREKATAS